MLLRVSALQHVRRNPDVFPDVRPMNAPRSATLSDLAGLGLLEGRRVRLREDVGSWVRAGIVGVVLEVRSSEPRAIVCYPESVLIESPFAKLELVGEDEGA
jgi:hypothetical protein